MAKNREMNQFHKKFKNICIYQEGDSLVCIYKFFRVFSHGQITFGDHEVPPSEENTMPPKSGGHKRTASKTDFILPPEHAEKERKRNSLQRQNSEGGTGAILTSAGSFKKRQDSGSGHR